MLALLQSLTENNQNYPHQGPHHNDVLKEKLGREIERAETDPALQGGRCDAWPQLQIISEAQVRSVRHLETALPLSGIVNM